MTQYCQYVARTGIKETVVITLGDLQRFLDYKIQVCCKNSIPFFNSFYFFA